MVECQRPTWIDSFRIAREAAPCPIDSFDAVYWGRVTAELMRGILRLRFFQPNLDRLLVFSDIEHIAEGLEV